jgi:uncharacterized protein YeaO (DUF488 family)
MVQLKQAYEKPLPKDGFRVLVERFWPRDLNEKHAKLDLWLKDVAPSRELHKQFGDNPNPAEWVEFQSRYERELKQKRKAIKLLQQKMHEGDLTWFTPPTIRTTARRPC